MIEKDLEAAIVLSNDRNVREAYNSLGKKISHPSYLNILLNEMRETSRHDNLLFLYSPHKMRCSTTRNKKKRNKFHHFNACSEDVYHFITFSLDVTHFVKRQEDIEEDLRVLGRVRGKRKIVPYQFMNFS